MLVGKTHFTQATCAWNYITELWILQEFILQPA